MNKVQLVEEIQKLLGKDASKACAERALNAVLDAVKAGTKKYEKLQLVGFGSFSVVKRKKRTCKNPRTGEKVEVPACKVVKFKAGAAFKA
ncbi:MAG: HU family DNA-binding protein [Verrucomicrobiaceae bacterium]|nr:HU family DNA-binding protein [Verrucomicrobiaceae bacterium]